MNPMTIPPANTAPVDQDLADQANPGHGIPSQDPNTAAQTPLEPHEAEREAKSVLVGGGMVAGAATGAVIGIAVAGPVGILAGATLGAVAGALGGAATGAATSPEDSDSVGTAPADTVHLHIDDSGGGGRPVGFSLDGGEVARCVARHGESRLRSVVSASNSSPRTSSRPTVCFRSASRSAARRSPCATSRRSMGRWRAWTRSPRPTSVKT